MTKKQIIAVIQLANDEIGTGQWDYNHMTSSDKAMLNIIRSFRDYALINEDEDIVNALELIID